MVFTLLALSVTFFISQTKWEMGIKNIVVGIAIVVGIGISIAVGCIWIRPSSKKPSSDKKEHRKFEIWMIVTKFYLIKKLLNSIWLD